MQIRPQAAGPSSGSKRSACSAPQATSRQHWCEMKRLAGAGCLEPQLDRHERHVVDRDAALFDSVTRK